MRARFLTHLIRKEDAAVAPIVAISLFALVAAGGIAFDYARMATLDTELQAAADQAALAAATQLDGKSDSITRATNAAQNLVSNRSLFANDANASGNSVTIPTLTFYSSYTDPSSNTATTDGASAKFVKISTATRSAFFALTPIVGVLSANNLMGTAVAGLGSAVCKTPPVMLCNPNEPGSTAFDANGLRGYGLKLISGDASAPGNFGFLETGIGNGASALASALGWNNIPGDCLTTTNVETKTGMNAVVLNAMNTRFDLDTNGANTCPAGGTCSPAANVRKDLVKGSNCGTSGNQGWQESANPYRPTSVGPITSGYPDVMGYPRDYCHAVKQSTQTCGTLGTGSWDRDAFFKVNYNWNHATWMSQTGLPANVSRYKVYEWENAHTNVGGKGIAVSQTASGKTAYSYPVCRGAGITPGPTQPDRRRISVAVINCNALGLHGHATNVAVLKWIDVFLVEPSFNRGSGANKFTEDKEIYAEIIGESTAGTAGSTVGQVVRHDVPYLIE